MSDVLPTGRAEEGTISEAPTPAPGDLPAPEAPSGGGGPARRSAVLHRKWAVVLGLIVSHLLCLAIGWLLPRSQWGGLSRLVSRSRDLKTFVNSKTGLSPEVLQNYVDFSFDYPASWKLIPGNSKGNEKNFIKVERAVPGTKVGEDLTLENFNVGHLSFTGRSEEIEPKLPLLAEDFSNQFARQFPNYKKTAQGPTSINQYRGYEFRFTGRIDSTPKGPLTYWGRCVMVLPAGTDGRGVILVMLVTSLAPDYANENDIGIKGELPIILNSFKLGR